MPPIRESGQRSARASAAVDLRTSSCISRTAATNATRCEWETDIEKRVSAAEQRVSATEQIGRDTRRELGEIRELLQAALPNAANVGAATASCTQEAIMANTNTGIVGPFFVDRSSWYYIWYCHHIATCSCVRGSK